ncbi:NUDIX hydrolase [Clostridium lacusfryxellense]|uniref:NUDIX hydrolase n=1 Tax=Clostridium lacusfryxellense TaxID=205328 RepID=UPI001C0D2848|nr:NUDIX hydrolase [Clostridium lacusfryxellense]MBU3113060.1 NUDIX hydrolase [Clostridium lacusfryxellense]
MNYIDQIKEFVPINDQESQDRKIIIDYNEQFSHSILLRDNAIAHITSSGFIMNKTLDKVLMVHHNIRNVWSWTGGHADGDRDLLKVAIKEAREETGIINVKPLTQSIIAIDILPVYGHMKKGKYVSGHLHLSISYILTTSEEEKLIVNEDENSGVRWFELDKFNDNYFDIHDVYLYNKLIKRAKQIGNHE